MNSATMIRGATGLIYDNRMSEHRCLWEPDYPECPERFTRVLERCTQLNLIERCQVIFSRNGTLDEILLKHTEDHYNSLKSISQCTNETELEEHSSRYDAIYFHPVRDIHFQLNIKNPNIQYLFVNLFFIDYI